MKKALYFIFVRICFMSFALNGMESKNLVPLDPCVSSDFYNPAGHVNYPTCLWETLGYKSFYNAPLEQSCKKCRDCIVFYFSTTEEYRRKRMQNK